ncbi:unnamed protein product [Rotaria socialis]|uniref:Aspartyl protease n=1 Tax=Rotaria socialis TaxID=392032 RepID=A0A821MG18_9BILA|nr:unnamed protein product [Rotaria socialis]CAF3370169.1 unnamed protein product [Rotaria socialis]CAF3509990.1 unnamed protein product [Rotaria socialis]CAF3621577.1 unnamed protein product [Rotaria socialis]CAF4357446.1 unnamed protein product [Rotaria socialis]
MTTFDVKFLDGHIIVGINKFEYIVDTGSPVSFGRATTICINGKSFPIFDGGLHGITADSISTLSGLQVDGLIGMNILANFDIQFTRKQITFSNSPLFQTDKAITVPIVAAVMGIPIILLSIAQKNRRIFFDTGAKLSYLSDDLLVGNSIGEVDDFYPSIGAYKTKVYKIDVAINGKVESLIFGSLPSSLRILLQLGQTEGIIGTELLTKYYVTLSNLNKTLILEPLDEEESFD